MAWRIHIATNIIFYLISAVAATVLGNILVTGYIPELGEHGTRVSRFLVDVLTLPTSTVEPLARRFSVGALLVAGVIAIGGFVGAQIAVLLQPARRRLAGQLVRERGIDLSDAETFVRSKSGAVRRLRWSAARRNFGKQLSVMTFYFLVGGAAAGASWGIVALANMNVSSTWQNVASGAAVVVLLAMAEIRSALKEAPRRAGLDEFLDMFSDQRPVTMAPSAAPPMPPLSSPVADDFFSN